MHKLMAVLMVVGFSAGAMATSHNQLHAGLSKKEAKDACLKDNPSLKGKELKACIHSKIKG